jgi:hypothetical protein
VHDVHGGGPGDLLKFVVLEVVPFFYSDFFLPGTARIR